MQQLKRFTGLLMSVLFLFGCILVAGCNQDAGTKTDQEAAHNAMKDQKRVATPPNPNKPGIAPPGI
jgi:predicted small secreted protein